MKSTSPHQGWCFLIAAAVKATDRSALCALALLQAFAFQPIGLHANKVRTPQGFEGAPWGVPVAFGSDQPILQASLQLV